MNEEVIGCGQEIEELHVKITTITKENKNLAKKLEEKSRELHDTNNYINERSFEFREISENHSKKVKELNNSPLHKSREREQLEKDLSKKKECFVQQIIERVTNEVSEVEELAKKNEEIGDLNKGAILFAAGMVKRKVLEGIDKQYLSRDDTTNSKHLSELKDTDENKFANGQSSRPELHCTSTPEKSGMASAQKFPDLSMSPIAKPDETNEGKGKENSGPQIYKSPNTSVSSTGLLPLKDTTNIADLSACTGGA